MEGGDLQVATWIKDEGFDTTIPSVMQVLQPGPLQGSLHGHSLLFLRDKALSSLHMTIKSLLLPIHMDGKQLPQCRPSVQYVSLAGYLIPGTLRRETSQPMQASSNVAAGACDADQERCVQALENAKANDLLFWASRYNLFVLWSADRTHPWDSLPGAASYVTLEIGKQRGSDSEVPFPFLAVAGNAASGVCDDLKVTAKLCIAMHVCKELVRDAAP